MTRGASWLPTPSIVTASPALKSCETLPATSPLRSRRPPGKLAAERRCRAVRAGLAALRHADRRCFAHEQAGPDADHRPDGLLMMRIALWILGALLLGGIVHLSTVLAMPTAATQDAYSRLSQRTPVNGVVPLPAASGQDATMPFMDPAFAIAVCRYDLSGGSLKLHAPLSQAYTS